MFVEVLQNWNFVPPFFKTTNMYTKWRAQKAQGHISAEGYDVHPVFQSQHEDLLLKTVPDGVGSNQLLNSGLHQSQHSDQKPKLDESRDSVFPPQHSSATQEFVL